MMEPLTSTICRSCRIRLNKLPVSRAFSTTSPRRIVPPESPDYVDVPTSFQGEFVSKPQRKGVLPVPRELFPAKRPDKPSQQYLDNVTKNPLPQNVKSEENLTELERFKQRAAETRKRHLREGLAELYRRKQETMAKQEYRSNQKRAERARLIAQAEREDARLTSTSTPIAMRSTKSTTPIADDLQAIKALYLQKKANYERVTQSKQEERLDALHALYMNARNFITTEEQLNEAIEEQFDPEVFRNDKDSDGKSIWSISPPDTIKEMIYKSRGGEKSTGVSLNDISRANADGPTRARFVMDQKRLKKIAEKLSGGKI